MLNHNRTPSKSQLLKDDMVLFDFLRTLVASEIEEKTRVVQWSRRMEISLDVKKKERNWVEIRR